MRSEYVLKKSGETIVAKPPQVKAMLFIKSALTRLSDAHPQHTRPMVLVMPITDNMNAHLSGAMPAVNCDCQFQLHPSSNIYLKVWLGHRCK